MGNLIYKYKDSMVAYSVGQGMGIYSSWPAMALTNHFVVRLAAYSVGKPQFTEYLVLGDDVVIVGKDVANKYTEIMTGMGVRISLGKSITPSDTMGLEFASKLICQTGNLSPLPILLFLEGGFTGKVLILKHIYEACRSYALNTPSLWTVLDALFPNQKIRNRGLGQKEVQLLALHALNIVLCRELTKEQIEGGTGIMLWGPLDQIPYRSSGQADPDHIISDLQLTLGIIPLEWVKDSVAEGQTKILANLLRNTELLLKIEVELQTTFDWSLQVIHSILEPLSTREGGCERPGDGT